METPILAQEIVGTKKILSGGLFTPKRNEPETEYDIIDWRWGSGFIMDVKKMERKHPTVEFLIKNETMKRSRWTRGFPVREYIPNGEEGWILDNNFNTAHQAKS